MLSIKPFVIPTERKHKIIERCHGLLMLKVQLKKAVICSVSSICNLISKSIGCRMSYSRELLAIEEALMVRTSLQRNCSDETATVVEALVYLQQALSFPITM